MMLSKHEDNQLIDLAVQGDQEAFSQLVSRYYKKIRLLIYLYVREPSVSNDLTQDVFIKVYQYLQHFKKQCKFSTWLYQITLNTVKNYFRMIQLRRECQFGDHEQLYHDNLSPESISIGIELNQKFEHAYSNLPRQVQRCYHMHAIDGKSYQEISQALQCPLGTVRSRIFRARELLKAAI